MTHDTALPPRARATRGLEPDSGAARIMRAAIQAVSEGGLASLTAENLCIRAGATRSEFDEYWCDPTDAFVDAIDDLMTLPRLPDRGGLQEDLTAYVAAYLDRCSDPAFVASMVHVTVQARLDEELAAKVFPDFVRRRDVNRGLIDRAVARGELSRDKDPDLILDRVLGMAFSWMGVGHKPTPEEIDIAIRDLLARELKASPGPGC